MSYDYAGNRRCQYDFPRSVQPFRPYQPVQPRRVTCWDPPASRVEVLRPPSWPDPESPYVSHHLDPPDPSRHLSAMTRRGDGQSKLSLRDNPEGSNPPRTFPGSSEIFSAGLEKIMARFDKLESRLESCEEIDRQVKNLCASKAAYRRQSDADFDSGAPMRRPRTGYPPIEYRDRAQDARARPRSGYAERSHLFDRRDQRVQLGFDRHPSHETQRRRQPTCWDPPWTRRTTAYQHSSSYELDMYSPSPPKRRPTCWDPPVYRETPRQRPFNEVSVYDQSLTPVPNSRRNQPYTARDTAAPLHTCPRGYSVGGLASQQPRSEIIAEDPINAELDILLEVWDKKETHVDAIDRRVSQIRSSPQHYFHNQPTPSNDYHQSLQLSSLQPLVTEALSHQNYPQLPPPTTYHPPPSSSPTTYQQPLLTSAATDTSLLHQNHQPQPPNAHQQPPPNTHQPPQPPLIAAPTASLPYQNYQPDGLQPCTSKPQLGWPPPTPQHSLADWSLPCHGRSAAPLPAAVVVISKGKIDSSLSGLNLFGKFDREQGNFNSVYGPRMKVREGMNYRLALLDADARLIPPRNDTPCLSILRGVNKIFILAWNFFDNIGSHLLIFCGGDEGRRSIVRYVFDPGGDVSPRLLLSTLAVALWFPP